MQFRLADLLYWCAELSTANVDTLLELWAISMAEFNVPTPFRSNQDMHTIIDSSQFGDIPWECLVTGFSEDVDEHAPVWKQRSYEVWYRDPEKVISTMLDNPDFKEQFDLCLYLDLDAAGMRRWGNVMSGNTAWRHCVSHAGLMSKTQCNIC